MNNFEQHLYSKLHEISTNERSPKPTLECPLCGRTGEDSPDSKSDLSEYYNKELNTNPKYKGLMSKAKNVVQSGNKPYLCPHCALKSFKDLSEANRRSQVYDEESDEDLPEGEPMGSSQSQSPQELERGEQNRKRGERYRRARRKKTTQRKKSNQDRKRKRQGGWR